MHKGATLLAEVAASARPGTLEFHLVGTAGDVLAGHVVDHGPYRREEFSHLVADIRPHIAVILSLAPETGATP